MKFSGVVLAGGKSQRMGRDKAALTLDGRPLWQRQAALLREAGVESVAISGRPDGPYIGGEIPVILDDHPGCGPLAGIAMALAVCNAPLLVVLGVDMPRVTGAFLRRLIALAAPGKGIVPVHDGMAEGCAAIYPREAAGSAQEALRRKEYSLQRWTRELAAMGLILFESLSPGEGELLRSWNTPGDISYIADP